MGYNQNSSTKQKNESSDTAKIIVEEKEIKSPNVISNHFNKFFCNIGKNL